MLLGGSAPEERTVCAIRRWMAALWRRYGWALSLIAGVYALSALAIFALVIASLSRGGEPVLFTTHLIGTITGSVDAIAGSSFTSRSSTAGVDSPCRWEGWAGDRLFRPNARRSCSLLGWLALAWFPRDSDPGIRWRASHHRLPARRCCSGAAGASPACIAQMDVARSSAGPGGRARRGGWSLVLIVWALVFRNSVCQPDCDSPAKLRLPNEGDYGVFAADQMAVCRIPGFSTSTGRRWWLGAGPAVCDDLRAGDFCDLVAFFHGLAWSACTAIVTDEDNDAALPLKREGIWARSSSRIWRALIAYVITDVSRLDHTRMRPRRGSPCSRSRVARGAAIRLARACDNGAAGWVCALAPWGDQISGAGLDRVRQGADAFSGFCR